MRLLPPAISYKTATALASDEVNQERETLASEFASAFNGKSLSLILENNEGVIETRLNPDCPIVQDINILRQKYGLEKLIWAPAMFDAYAGKRFEKQGIIAPRSVSHAQSQCKEFLGEVIVSTSVPSPAMHHSNGTRLGSVSIRGFRVL